jgi:trans-2,3-dihydro-3-hydroxyanthranilate isomerase
MPDRSALRYRVVDVFTNTPLEGNPLAVFPDASGIDPALMPRIARELNLAETTFVLPATRGDCVARVRIFTPMREMRFAGHPTLGTAFVLLDEGHVPTQANPFLLEELVGPVPVRVDAASPPMLWLRTPPIEAGPSYDHQQCAQMLGLARADLLDATPQIYSAGNPTLFVALRDHDAVDRAWLDLRGSQQLRGSIAEPICVFVFTPTSNGAYSRMFAPEHGVSEDPATGSATGPLAAFMMRHGFVSRMHGTRFVSEQGSKMGRPSQLHVHVRGREGADGIEVGGHVTPLVSASMYL